MQTFTIKNQKVNQMKTKISSINPINAMFKTLLKAEGNALNKYILLVSLLLLLSLNLSAAQPDEKASSLIDNFSDTTNNNYGFPRQFLNDSMMGGKTVAAQEMKDNKIHLSGNIVPARGQLGWSSTVFLLEGQDIGKDLSAYKGIKVRLKLNTGSLSISANSTEITNFDYHSTVLAVPVDGKYHDISVPFDSLKRAWSAQTTLNTASINSISIVAFGLQPSDYDFVIENISLY